MDALSILEDADPGWNHNIIVGLFNIILEGDPISPLRAICQLETQPLLKVGVIIRSSEQIYRSVNSVCLGSIPELSHVPIFC